MSLAPVSTIALTSAPLMFGRLRLAPEERPPAGLGGRRVGTGQGALAAALLSPRGDVYDAWTGEAPIQEGRHGSVHFRTDGHWLHGVAEVDDRVLGLQDATLGVYRDLFAVLGANRCPHLLRIWNYLDDINVEVDGIERYRQFNVGRQQAFIEARRSAFEGAPAACALGTRGGPLRVQFLAGRSPPLAIENPRQISAYRYPDAYGPRSPTFSRAACVEAGGGRQALFISGTASIVGHESVHVGDVRRQTEESLLNIATLRQVAAARCGVTLAADELVYTVYVRHVSDLVNVRRAFEREVGARSAAAGDAVYLQADICRADLLVEIEAHGIAPGSGDAA